MKHHVVVINKKNKLLLPVHKFCSSTQYEILHLVLEDFQRFGNLKRKENEQNNSLKMLVEKRSEQTQLSTGLSEMILFRNRGEAGFGKSVDITLLK